MCGEHFKIGNRVVYWTRWNLTLNKKSRGRGEVEMKRLGEILTNPDGGAEIVMGNTAIVRAMLEAGVRVVTSYPGSPTPEIAEAIAAIPKDVNPLHFEFSTNEKVATEVAFGAAVNGYLSTVFFKSVGINVAADSFVQLGHMEIIGGMVIVLGDDPGANSSQNEQDNRHYARLSYIPVLEPATPAEVYIMFKEAARLSKERRMPVILRLTTHVCHAKEKVAFAAWKPQVFDDTPRFSPQNGPYVPITAKVFPLKRKALEKLAGFAQYADISKLNTQVDNGNRKRGIITMGAPFLSLMDVLADSPGKPDILKLGIVHPIPRKLIADFLRQHDEVKILEELDDVLERDVKALAYEQEIAVKIIGKTDIDDWMNEYTPSKVEAVVRKIWPDILPPGAEGSGDTHEYLELAPRPPQMCPGCGHRSAFYAIKQALAENDITVGDIGCHSLGHIEPYNMGQVLLCMGHSCGTAAGLSLFNKKRKVVAFLGDSTFFHAGLPGIINALYNNHNFTLIILENGTTAMTGHQDHPGVGKNFNGASEKIPVRRVLEGLGVTSIREVDTYLQAKLKAAVEEALAEDKFNVVIAKHPCMLKLTRDLKKSGRPLPNNQVEVTSVCNQSHNCVADFACPTFQREANGTVRVQPDLCIGDGSCRQTCPVGAIAYKATEHPKEG